MHCPQTLVDTLSVPNPNPDKHRKLWLYHSRGDLHSTVACWGILLDLMANCPPLVAQFRSGTVAFGINHEMRDFQQNRKKNLDLVIRTRGSGAPTKKASFTSLVEEYGIVLSASAEALLQQLPDLEEIPVGAVRVALEAKAAMTAHIKALPRLHDELNSSHLTIHGSSVEVLAVGFVMVNVADRFISPDMNKWLLDEHAIHVASHRQLGDATRVIERTSEILRNSRERGTGFDAVGLVVVDCVNDAVPPVKPHTGTPAPQSGDIFHYDSMIQRLVELYGGRFS